MLESLKRNETFEYQKLTPEEMSARGILGRLVGPCADFINPTRNGRKYPEELWEKVFEDPIMQEKIKNGVCFGELGHPAERTETDMEKIAICLREQPKKNSDGQLIACFDILDTPNGRILKTLCDYGTIVGVSSRGQGDIISDENGDDMVDPDTYECECWDVVLVPAVESARMQYVKESLDTTTKNGAKLKEALCENLNKASASERKVMTETLHNLGLNVETQEDKSAESEASEQTEIKSVEANNDGSNELIESLQEAIKSKTELESQVRELQEKLAVANGKVSEVTGELVKYRNATSRLSATVKESKELKEKVSTLEEELKEKQTEIDSQGKRIASLVERKERRTSETKSLTESVSKKDAEIKTLNEQLNALTTGYKSQVSQLNEQISSLKETSAKREAELSKKLTEAVKLKESYKKLAEQTVNNYIESKATLLGVTPQEIKNRLSESYTLSEIDEVCEDLQNYEINIGKLPFNVGRKTKVRVSESKHEQLKVSNNEDDDVDESLIRLANLSK